LGAVHLLSNAKNQFFGPHFPLCPKFFIKKIFLCLTCHKITPMGTVGFSELNWENSVEFYSNLNFHEISKIKFLLDGNTEIY